MSYWGCVQLVPHHERLALHCLERVATLQKLGLNVETMKPVGVGNLPTGIGVLPPT
jgi:hypothetical protein